MEYYNIAVSFFKEGGVFMYPITLIFAVGVAISIERYMYLNMSSIRSKKAWDEVLRVVKKGNLDKAITKASASKAALGKILSYGLIRAKTARRREDIEFAMEEGLMEIVARLEKRTHYIATFANIATLLGLLGTIIGLISAFTAVSNANPADKADLLSASISVAMNTTAYGLMASIPLLLVYSYLSSKTTELIDSIEMAAVRFLNAITEHLQNQRA